MFRQQSWELRVPVGVKVIHLAYCSRDEISSRQVNQFSGWLHGAALFSTMGFDLMRLPRRTLRTSTSPLLWHRLPHPPSSLSAPSPRYYHQLVFYG
jgi:hypothetical protein